ncbi:MAG: ATP-binding protein [Desulfuromonadaceae bacterium]|nr:ATP-binding protein [Desulfuromonadaceae bacterium]
MIVNEKTANLEAELVERKKREDDLEMKNAELERFAYTVSHDLKSPIITIKGFTGALEKDLLKGNYERMTGDLKRVSAAADKMSDLLNDLLQISTVGRVVNTSEAVDMNLLASDVLAQLAGPLKNSAVKVTVQPDLPKLFCDRKRIAEVLQNLFENAINYMGDQSDPKILFGVRVESGVKVFFVQDNGIGVDPKYQQNIFGLFNKLDAKSSGTGIGLALVKRIVEVHGGRVWVESDGIGKGSRFCFTVG